MQDRISDWNFKKLESQQRAPCFCIGFVGFNEFTKPVWAEGAANFGELFQHQVFSQKHWELPPKNQIIKWGRKAYFRDANGKIIRPTQTNNKKSKQIKDQENVNSAV